MLRLMNLAILLAFVAVYVSAAPSSSSCTDADWEEFKAKYNKVYANAAAEQEAQEAFMSNCNFVRAKKSSSSSYTTGINQFSDLSYKKFATQYLNYKHVTNPRVAQQAFPKLVGAPSSVSVNWTAKGFTPSVENQGVCGSCYGFATADAWSGAYAKKKNAKAVLFSAQQIVDCTNNTVYKNLGCDGGSLINSMIYLLDYGFQTAASYPYVNVANTINKSTCKYNAAKVYDDKARAAAKAYYATGESNLLAIVNYEPALISFYVSREFQSYRSGIFKQKSYTSSNVVNVCASTANHAVTVVGYGTDSVQGDYWIIKNSWGTSWGERGYARIAKGRYESCVGAWNYYFMF